VNVVKFSSKAQFLVSAGMDAVIKVTDLNTYEELQTLEGHQTNIFSLDISHDDRYCVSGSSDKTIRLWDLASGEEIAELTGHSDWVTAVAFSPYSRRILSGKKISFFPTLT